MQVKLTSTLITLLVVTLLSSCGNGTEKGNQKDCLVCERINFFEEIKRDLSSGYWPTFNSDKLTSPLLYFEDSATYVAFSDELSFKDITYEKINCPQGTSILRMNTRFDSIAFHMENKMTFTDTLAPYYFRAIMFCSDVETASRVVPVVTNTEEWAQMVMHEYFHAFAFRHVKCMNYLSDSITVQVDSLHGFFRKNPWFQNYLEKENTYLLKAIGISNIDSSHHYKNLFRKTRNDRRRQFMKTFHFDISKGEEFWEKLEGTARYMEYNTGFVYETKRKEGFHGVSCDHRFDHYKKFSNRDFLKKPWFYEKTKMMTAYYYVTGFNLCRLLDRYAVNYKTDLFNEPSKSLESYLP